MTCSVEDCEREVHSRGLCAPHYTAKRKSGELESIKYPAKCVSHGCVNPARARGLCHMHYQRVRRDPEFAKQTHDNYKCEVPGCTRRARSRGMCQKHYQRHSRGIPLVLERDNYTDWCSFEGCERRMKSAGLCDAHYLQHLKGQELHPLRPYTYDGVACSIPNCERQAHAKGLCKTHYGRKRRGTLTETGESIVTVKYRNRVEDTEELLSFGVHDVKELALRAGWPNHYAMLQQVPLELKDRIQRMVD